MSEAAAAAEAAEAEEEEEAATLCASLIASRPEGLIELGAAGVVAWRSAALVRCAQAEAHGCDALHAPPPPGAQAWPLLRSLRALLGQPARRKQRRLRRSPARGEHWRAA